MDSKPLSFTCNHGLSFSLPDANRLAEIPASIYTVSKDLAHLCSSMLIYAHLCSSMLIYAHLCSSMLIYAHLCSSMLIYAHLCSSMGILLSSTGNLPPSL